MLLTPVRLGRHSDALQLFTDLLIAGKIHLHSALTQSREEDVVKQKENKKRVMGKNAYTLREIE